MSEACLVNMKINNIMEQMKGIEERNDEIRDEWNDQLIDDKMNLRQ